MSQVDRPYLDFLRESERPKPLPRVPSVPPRAPSNGDPPPIPVRGGDVNEILRCVCQAFLVSRAELSSSSRLRNLMEARLVAYWLLRTLGGLSYPEIGKALNKDHTSAISGVKRCERMRERDASFCDFTSSLAVAADARIGKEST